MARGARRAVRHARTRDPGGHVAGDGAEAPAPAARCGDAVGADSGGRAVRAVRVRQGSRRERGRSVPVGRGASCSRVRDALARSRPGTRRKAFRGKK